MKVRICYTIEVDDEYRRAVRSYYGDNGKASREELVNWFKTYGESMNADVLWEYEQERQEEEEEN